MNDVLQKSAGEYVPRGRLDPAGFDRHVSFRAYPPPVDLAPFVEHFWSLCWNEPQPYVSEEVMHRPYVDVYLSKQESGVQGTFRGKRAYVAAGTGRIVGARFKPGAFHVFYDGRIADLLDKNLSLAQAFPWAGADRLDGLLAPEDDATIDGLIGLLRDRTPPVPDPHIELVGAIIAAVETNQELLSVSAAAERFGRSERWLQKLFQDYVGVGLKWLLQRHRLLSAVEQIRSAERPDWAAIAYEQGFSSQQHFITAFKKIVGKTPMQYKNALVQQ